MAKNHLTSKTIEITGWVCGLIAAVAGDYWMLSRLAGKSSGKLGAIALALVSGLIVIFVFVEISRRVANGLRRKTEITEPKKKAPKKTPVDQMPLGTRITITILALLIAVSMVFGGYR